MFNILNKEMRKLGWYVTPKALDPNHFFQLFRDSSILLLEAVLRVAVCPLFCLLLFFLFLLFQSHFLR